MRARRLILNINYIMTALLLSGAQAHAEAVIAGLVQAKDECALAPMEAWLSAGSLLLYQVEIPQHGTFEFHVNSGKYNLVVIGATGCLAEAEIEARENDTRRITLTPMPVPVPATAPAEKPKAKRSALDWLIPQAQAATQDCPICNRGQAVEPPLSSLPSQSPWWLPYGELTYTNVRSPGPWRNGGIDGSMYPGQGAVFAADPVLYVNGPEGAAIKIRARLSESSHWLVAVPEHGEKSWSGVISQNKFKSEDAAYQHIFYDYRADQKKFQDSRGFCVGRGELIPRLSEALKASGFQKNEIEDFASFWRFRIPASERYCVYPQSNAELTQSVQLEISPKPASLTQLLLIVQVGENLDGKGKFRRAPVATWKPELKPEMKPEPPQHREPAADALSGIDIREWGIGFLEGTSTNRGSHD